MRSLHICGLLLALVGWMALVTQADARRSPDKEKPRNKKDKDDKDKSGFADLGDVHAEVTVLQVLHALQPTRAQLEQLAKVAEKTMQKPPRASSSRCPTNTKRR